jgi:hypothetical protein
MIEIRQTPEGNALILSSVSEFCGAMGYCEVRVKHFLKGIKPPQTKITLDGIKSHEAEEAYEREHFKFEPVTKEALEDFTKDIEFAREGLYTRLQRTLVFGEETLQVLVYGRADKVMRSRGTLIVEDSKYPTSRDKYQDKFEPFDDQKLQTLLYLNSSFSEKSSFAGEDCFDISCEKRAWIINIKDKATLESVKVFQGYQTKQAEDFLEGKLSKFALLVLGKMEPAHHGNPRKCHSCRFETCEFRAL